MRSAGLSSSSAFHLCRGSRCWHLQVWCLCFAQEGRFSRSWAETRGPCCLFDQQIGGDVFKCCTRLQFCQPIEINQTVHFFLFSLLTRILNLNHRVRFFLNLESYLAQAYKTLSSERICCVLFVCSFVFWKWCLNVHYCVVNMPFNVHSPFIRKKETFFFLVNYTFQDSTHRPKVEFSIPQCIVKCVTCLALKVGTAHF